MITSNLIKSIVLYFILVADTSFSQDWPVLQLTIDSCTRDSSGYIEDITFSIEFDELYNKEIVYIFISGTNGCYMKKNFAVNRELGNYYIIDYPYDMKRMYFKGDKITLTRKFSCKILKVNKGYFKYLQTNQGYSKDYNFEICKGCN